MSESEIGAVWPSSSLPLGDLGQVSGCMYLCHITAKSVPEPGVIV